jgi:hypothetical protein
LVWEYAATYAGATEWVNLKMHIAEEMLLIQVGYSLVLQD